MRRLRAPAHAASLLNGCDTAEGHPVASSTPSTPERMADVVDIATCDHMPLASMSTSVGRGVKAGGDAFVPMNGTLCTAWLHTLAARRPPPTDTAAIHGVLAAVFIRE